MFLENVPPGENVPNSEQFYHMITVTRLHTNIEFDTLANNFIEVYSKYEYERK